MRFARRAFALRDSRAISAIARFVVATRLRRVVTDNDVRLAGPVELHLAETPHVTRTDAKIGELSMSLSENALGGFGAVGICDVTNGHGHFRARGRWAFAYWIAVTVSSLN